MDFAVVLGQAEKMLLKADFSIRSKGVYSALDLLHRCSLSSTDKGSARQKEDLHKHFSIHT